MTHTEKALALYQAKFNCCQSVFGAFCEDYGVNQKEALRMTCGMGGGVRSGDVCGAVSGSVMVIGLKYGHCQEDELDKKSECYRKTIEYVTLFRERYGSICCRDLLGYDFSKPEEEKIIQERGLIWEVCPTVISNAIALLEELGY